MVPDVPAPRTPWVGSTVTPGARVPLSLGRPRCCCAQASANPLPHANDVLLQLLEGVIVQSPSSLEVRSSHMKRISMVMVTTCPPGSRRKARERIIPCHRAVPFQSGWEVAAGAARGRLQETGHRAERGQLGIEQGSWRRGA